jgi:serine/threonine protein kinase
MDIGHWESTVPFVSAYGFVYLITNTVSNKKYIGKKLLSDIEKFGKDKFKFEIIRFCDSKSELAYYEAKEQFDREVLMSDEYYNGIINLRIGKIKRKV